ncbi:hypothetical protein ACPPVV_08340 [Rhodanobacter sp. Col0626]|uniref:hypothetical protein n=1 Tax=Rhodanobacter sp. Col0626 TaxID=3415679 RepID=UPI003CEB1F2C
MHIVRELELLREHSHALLALEMEHLQRMRNGRLIVAVGISSASSFNMTGFSRIEPPSTKRNRTPSMVRVRRNRWQPDEMFPDRAPNMGVFVRESSL